MKGRRSYLEGFLAGASSALALTLLWGMTTVARADNLENPYSFGPWKIQAAEHLQARTSTKLQ